MKKELEYFLVGECYGGDQERLTDFMMKHGGCAAVTACDSCIYFDCYRGTSHLYPFDRTQITQENYRDFTMVMKPYLRPRWTGIDTLELFMEGFGAYLAACGVQIRMTPFDGERPFEEARETIRRQIDNGFPVPYLMLNHRDLALDDYAWHWFLLTGYEESEAGFLVKVVTYGEWVWLDLAHMWDTGRRRKGGLILYDMD